MAKLHVEFSQYVALPMCVFNTIIKINQKYNIKKDEI